MLCVKMQQTEEHIDSLRLRKDDGGGFGSATPSASVVPRLCEHGLVGSGAVGAKTGYTRGMRGINLKSMNWKVT